MKWRYSGGFSTCDQFRAPAVPVAQHPLPAPAETCERDWTGPSALLALHIHPALGAGGAGAAGRQAQNPRRTKRQRTPRANGLSGVEVLEMLELQRKTAMVSQEQLVFLRTNTSLNSSSCTRNRAERDSQCRKKASQQHPQRRRRSKQTRQTKPAQLLDLQQPGRSYHCSLIAW
mmetsp:Transcript_10266/g.24666  ORF Transcript_10266/g.24666 Transcript_10266/m.24666 type:complete len:174 (-) Transcript_10266:262-783(-)